jgi:hypothetical protein
MGYSELAALSNPEFKRLSGVSRQTFKEMVELLRPHLERRGKRGVPYPESTIVGGI